jgi:hypothetical protein
MTRYRLSLELPRLVPAAVRGLAWNVDGSHFAFVPTVEGWFYAVVFTLRLLRGLPPAELELFVNSAFPCDRGEPATFGPVPFPHLMTLRLRGERPARDLSAGRKRPRLRPP